MRHLLLACGLCACALGTARAPAPPRVLVGGAALAGVDTLELTLAVDNPTGATITLVAVDWEVAEGGRALARGRVEPAVNVGPRARVELPLRAPVGPGRAERVRAAPAWRVTGVAHFGNGVGVVF
jgi:hypothetical protein